MRIQSGSARGRKLKSRPKGYEVRPILARIRKSLFDILRPRIGGTAFLDLYAGIGTVGLEALSNGASRAVFVDIDKTSLQRIQRNTEDMRFLDRAEIRRGDATQNLLWLGGRTFDLIFLGPPYKDESKNPLALTVPTLSRILEAGLAGPDTWIIAQHHKKESLDAAPPALELFRRNVYGDSVLSFFRLKPAAA
ncbi:MAG: 16S rRNA (guanine(966)-N(2))-methyltransferase RsmD [Elusimicrobiota bacterium]